MFKNFDIYLNDSILISDHSNLHSKNFIKYHVCLNSLPFGPKVLVDLVKGFTYFVLINMNHII